MIRQHRPASRNHHGHQHQAGAGPSPKLAAFLAETLQAVQSGAIGREMARDAIRAWPTVHPSDICAKSAAIRQLATIPST